MLHTHTAEEECEVTKLIEIIDKKNGNKKNPLFARNNSIIKARIKLNRTVCMEAFEDVPMLGRFTLRDEGKTSGNQHCQDKFCILQNKWINVR